MDIQKITVLIVSGLIGWAICGSIIGIGRKLTTLRNTLIIHAVGVIIIFAIISLIYFKYFHYTNPFQTAVFYTLMAILLDGLIIAPFVEKSFKMFTSIIGTWIPFAFIFFTTYFTGLLVLK